ncbi:EscT/YscT/HrcT family type III secretion system export apparatus protein [Imbroritus primus]|uniref:EscT/YscT/HrcT family type III secretion system export apparatus protein n=1 Tax=Imbroritus primus TaxID=3058603 RepID=A0ACD3SLQ3_9BURK|nr:EscT/YscT/HrcT family type III secretion system export apparatus protein [Burkholderiaceae bacterium PBA]
MGSVSVAEVKEWLTALAYLQPRIMAMFLLIPMFNRELIPGAVLPAIVLAVSLVALPLVQPQIAMAGTLSGMQHTALILKEVMVGFVLGFLVAIPFWALEAVGFLIDNQRGASISDTLNPLTASDTSPLGLLFNQVFIIYFLLSGGMNLMLGILYDSFRFWSVMTWTPGLHMDYATFFLGQLDRLVQLSVVLAAPVLILMFMAEVGLALVNRFAPQLQVFFLAMPIKSALAFFILVLYAGTLMEYVGDEIRGLGGLFDQISIIWQGAR